MVKKIIYLLIVAHCFSCVTVNHKHLFYSKEEVKNNSKKLEGAYYYESMIDDEIWIYVIYLFDDGYFYDLGYIPSKSNLYGIKIPKHCNPERILTNTVESAIKNAECVINNYKVFLVPNSNILNRNSKFHRWGRYKIDKNNIKIRYFYNRLGDSFLAEKRGEILSDKKLSFNEVYYFRAKKNLSINETFEYVNLNVEIEAPNFIKSL
ncbi:conserved hypothetical protein [Tenacibaculum maritimum]|uniref:hypothetical protein n=1 Tax=Tenacibaculum maritimum TaxID=107401 RepID=UPI0012E6479B|nr:hypothetical protein [Tenacibaculum maritimum]CAA0199397.1 conserved hypothetical protein [Tenacibaculum maritimum]